MIIVSDTSPIANMLIIGQLDVIYRTMGQIIIPDKVAQEIYALEQFGIDTSVIDQSIWIEVQSPTDTNEVARLTHYLDAGEAEAIVLANEIGATYLLIDERKGRQIAQQYAIETIGLLGILLKAKQKGIVAAISPLIDDLKTKAGFWISDNLHNEILLIGNESDINKF